MLLNVTSAPSVGFGLRSRALARQAYFRRVKLLQTRKIDFLVFDKSDNFYSGATLVANKGPRGQHYTLYTSLRNKLCPQGGPTQHALYTLFRDASNKDLLAFVTEKAPEFLHLVQ